MASAYIIRSSGVAHETIDGETVILDMQQGAYYRLDGAASMAWSQLSHGATAEQLCATLAACFTAGPAIIETQVTEFLDALREFDLIVTHESNNGAALPSVANTGMAFPGLAIHRFTDLKELFWLDPVHEVDDTGWPTTRPKST